MFFVLDKCPFSDAHRDGAFVVRRADGKIGAGCLHNSCRAKRWPDLRDVVEPGWRERRPPAQSDRESSSSRHGEGRAGQGARPRPARRPPALLRYRQFPVEVLPAPISRFVVAVANAVRADVVMAAQPTLAVLSIAVGNSVRFQVKRRWQEPGILWPTVLAESGTGKSPAARLPLSLIQRRQGENLRRYEADLAEYAPRRLEYEALEREWKRKGAKLGEPCPELPEEPNCRWPPTSPPPRRCSTT
jgi:hypothetical protein